MGGGYCVPTDECDPSIEICESHYCFGKGCVCQIPLVSKCEEYDACTQKNGKCVTKAECDRRGEECEAICNTEAGCVCQFKCVDCENNPPPGKKRCTKANVVGK